MSPFASAERGRDITSAARAGGQPWLWADYAFGGGGSGAVERESGRSLTAAAIVTWTIAGVVMSSDPSSLLRIGAQDASA